MSEKPRQAGSRSKGSISRYTAARSKIQHKLKARNTTLPKAQPVDGLVGLATKILDSMINKDKSSSKRVAPNGPECHTLPSGHWRRTAKATATNDLHRERSEIFVVRKTQQLSCAARVAFYVYSKLIK